MADHAPLVRSTRRRTRKEIPAARSRARLLSSTTLGLGPVIRERIVDAVQDILAQSRRTGDVTAVFHHQSRDVAFGRRGGAGFLRLNRGCQPAFRVVAAMVEEADRLFELMQFAEQSLSTRQPQERVAQQVAPHRMAAAEMLRAQRRRTNAGAPEAGGAVCAAQRL